MRLIILIGNNYHLEKGIGTQKTEETIRTATMKIDEKSKKTTTTKKTGLRDGEEYLVV